MVHTQERVPPLCPKFETDSSIHSKVMWIPNLEIGSSDPGDAHMHWDRFMVRTQGRSVVHLCTKLKRIDSFESYEGSRNSEIGSRDHGHAHLWVALLDICRREEICPLF